jgi:hypothetical protein
LPVSGLRLRITEILVVSFNFGDQILHPDAQADAEGI